MDRKEAIEMIRKLEGCDLRPLADSFGITVYKNGKINKGWAGHTIERYLGLPLNSSRAPNFGSWELKVIPLKYNSSGSLQVKETMAITMLDPYEVSNKEFQNSHLHNKLHKILVVSRIFESVEERHSILFRCSEFDMDDPRLIKIITDDYQLVREAIMAKKPLTGKMGELIQPRTKGPGHGSTSRAFYARTQFVAHIIGLKDYFND